MSTELSRILARAGVPTIDETSAAATLAGGGQDDAVLLFFPGDPAQRPEALDVAVIFNELLAAFRGRLRGAIVAAGAEKALGKTFNVDVLPSLAVLRGAATVGVIPRIRDWAEYRAKIEAFLDQDGGAPAASAAPRVVITHSHKGAQP
jgi:hydrogenase-1 operon protein HyaE